MKSATDFCCSASGPCTEPISLTSKDATLPDQSTLSSDAYAKDAALQKMVNARYSTDLDGMPKSGKNDNKFDVPGT